MQVSKAKKGYKIVKSLFKKNIEIPESWEQIPSNASILGIEIK